jgi:hypothetical protein
MNEAFVRSDSRALQAGVNVLYLNPSHDRFYRVNGA